MGTHDEMRKQVKRKFRPESRDHGLCFKKLEEAEELIAKQSKDLMNMEDRLEATFDDARAAKKELEDSKEKWSTERCELKAKIKQLEEDVKHEKRRASQALDVSERTSEAASGIGRLLHVLVNNEVLEELRLSAHDRRTEARARMRHRQAG